MCVAVWSRAVHHCCAWCNQENVLHTVLSSFKGFVLWRGELQGTAGQGYFSLVSSLIPWWMACVQFVFLATPFLNMLEAHWICCIYLRIKIMAVKTCNEGTSCKVAIAWRMVLTWIVWSRVWKCGLDSPCSRLSPVVGFVNVVTNFRVPSEMNFLTSRTTVCFSRWTLFCWISYGLRRDCVRAELFGSLLVLSVWQEVNVSGITSVHLMCANRVIFSIR